MTRASVVLALLLAVVLACNLVGQSAAASGLLWGIGINIAATGMLAVGCLMAGLVVMPFALAALAWQHVGRTSYRRWGPVVGLLLALLAVLFFPAFGQATDPDYQEMAHDAVRMLKGSRVWVEVDPKVTTGNYDCNRRLISLGTAGNARWLLAHELGHHILGHCAEGFDQEVEANALAVRILQIWGMTEEAAYRMTANHLLGLQNFRKNNPRPGHDYCRELQALMTRYMGKYPPRDPQKVRETCPLAFPQSSLWLAQATCWPQSYTETYYDPRIGRTVLCSVFIDCYGNMTRICS